MVRGDAAGDVAPVANDHAVRNGTVRHFPREPVRAVASAIDALRQVTVHGRDYYPQGPHAYPQARPEMDVRLKALQPHEEAGVMGMVVQVVEPCDGY